MNKLLKPTTRRVVITGLGVVSSLGIGHETFWKNLIAGKSGISKVTAFDTSEYDRHFAGEIKNFNPEKFMNKRRAGSIGRASQMAIAASKLALKDSGLEKSDRFSKNFSVCVGTTVGELRLLEKFHDRSPLEKIRRSRDVAAVFPSSSLSSSIAMEFNARGFNSVFATACASGNYAIGQAFDLINSGKSKLALAGGSDSFSRVIFTGFGRLFAMAPEKCQPFDRNRQGMMVGEGSGILLLEDLESAEKRKAKIYAEVLGYGLSCDAHHMTAPAVKGVVKAIQKALKNSRISPNEVDYISAHGTGTKENDGTECSSIRQVFDNKTKKIPVSSIKSMLGHTMGAASALEAIGCCLAIKNSKIPPTTNFKEKDPECDIDCVPNKARRHKVNIALNNAQAFGGNNACLAFGKI